jgi:CheY-like chemotaxis protein
MDATRPPTRLADLANLIILVVDDDDDTLELVAKLLEDRNARVLRASDASQAFEELQRVRPDLLVSDIGLPGEDGCTMMERVRALPGERGGFTPAIALTSHTQESDRRRALRAGFWRHLPKPVDFPLLCAEVSRLAGCQDAVKRPV